MWWFQLPVVGMGSISGRGKLTAGTKLTRLLFVQLFPAQWWGSPLSFFSNVLAIWGYVFLPLVFRRTQDNICGLTLIFSLMATLSGSWSGRLWLTQHHPLNFLLHFSASGFPGWGTKRSCGFLGGRGISNWALSQRQRWLHHGDSLAIAHLSW